MIRSQFDLPLVVKLRRWWQMRPQAQDLLAARYGYQAPPDPADELTADRAAAIEAAVMARIAQQQKKLH